jgi:dTDP-L-rhamnose 4-epimerase
VVGSARGIPVVALRYFNVYGPRQALANPYTGVIPAFVGRILNRRPPEVYEDGAETRDFVHVGDVVRATLLALDRAGNVSMPAVVNVGTGRAHTLLEVARAVSRALNGPEPAVTGKFRVGDIRHCHADLAHARATLGFLPEVDFADGIGALAADLADQLHEDRSAGAEAELASRGLAARAK